MLGHLLEPRGPSEDVTVWQRQRSFQGVLVSWALKDEQEAVLLSQGNSVCGAQGWERTWQMQRRGELSGAGTGEAKRHPGRLRDLPLVVHVGVSLLCILICMNGSGLHLDALLILTPSPLSPGVLSARTLPQLYFQSPPSTELCSRCKSRPNGGGSGRGGRQAESFRPGASISLPPTPPPPHSTPPKAGWAGTPVPRPQESPQALHTGTKSSTHPARPRSTNHSPPIPQTAHLTQPPGTHTFHPT